MSLVQPLPDGPLDIVGDIHGELTALTSLLVHLGYSHNGQHPNGRKLVFVGDLCDRGPDSVGVIGLVQGLVENNNAYAVLGNHEINLLANDPKDGSGWFFSERTKSDKAFYAPFRQTLPEQHKPIRQFLTSLPLALERDDLRVVHAAWVGQAIAQVRNVPNNQVEQHYLLWNSAAQSAKPELYQRYLSEKVQWARQLEDGSVQPPVLQNIAEYEALEQMTNPIKVLTSGVEKNAPAPFFAGNRWRFSDRTPWWDDYNDRTPVVIGHYWRVFDPGKFAVISRYGGLFNTIDTTSWHGKHHNVFCVDYSVGARWRDRKSDKPFDPTRFRLAALQWPERRLVFDSGETITTL